MLEMLVIFAVLLALWGLYGKRHGAADEAAVAQAAPVASGTPAHERGAAARRHLGTL